MTAPLLLPLLLLAAPGGALIQPPGEFHAGEPVVSGGEAVLALHVDGRRARLVAATIVAARVHDDLSDAAGETTGWRIGPADDPAPPLAYLRAPGLRAGDVDVAGVDATGGAIEEVSLGVPGTVAIDFRGERARLVSACDPATKTVAEGQVQLRCSIDLHRDGAPPQRLAAMTGYVAGGGATVLGDDSPASLMFAGDLDRDGRLDLVIDLSHHYNVRRPTLFLSGAGKGGTGKAGTAAPLREAASFEQVGC